MFLGEFVVVYFVFVVLWGFSFDFFVVVGVVGFCFFLYFCGVLLVNYCWSRRTNRR